MVKIATKIPPFIFKYFSILHFQLLRIEESEDMNKKHIDIHEEMPILSEKAIHIGEIIKGKLDLERRSISWFAREMNCDRSNMYKMLSRSHLDTNFILRASKVLKHDFFKEISDLLKESVAEDWSNLILS